MRPDPLLITTGTAINGHQLALLHIKLFFLVYHPFVMAVPAQGLALIFIVKRWFTKLKYVCHESPYVYVVSPRRRARGGEPVLQGLELDGSIIPIQYKQYHANLSRAGGYAMQMASFRPLSKWGFNSGDSA
jgi:hypothetical protein